MYSPALFPSRLRAAPAKKRRLSAENGISSRETINGLPTLRDSICASSSALSSSTSASFSSSSARSAGVAARPSAQPAPAASPPAPPGRAPPPPPGVAGPGRLDRGVDVLGRAVRDLRDRLARRRVEDVHR